MHSPFKQMHLHQNVYVLRNNYFIISFSILRKNSTDRTLNSCIFILHPSFTVNRADFKFHVN